MNKLLPAFPTDVEPMATTVNHDGFDASQLEQEVSEIELETSYYFERADEMLRAIVRETRQPTFAEMNFFKSRCAWDSMQVNQQVRRIGTVVRLQSVVGTESQREAALNEKHKSAEIFETEGPRIDAKIAKLLEQKASLERAASQADKRCEQIQTACNELQKLELLRSDLAAKHNGLTQEFGESTWGEMNALEVEIQFREKLLSMPPNDSLTAHLKRNFPECVEIDQHTRKPKIIGFLWEAQKDVVQQELEEMRPRFESLQAIRDQQEAQLDEIRNHYVKEHK